MLAWDDVGLSPPSSVLSLSPGFSATVRTVTKRPLRALARLVLVKPSACVDCLAYLNVCFD